MASSLSSKPFLGTSRKEGFSGFGLGSLSSDLRTLSSSSLHFSTASPTPKKLRGLAKVELLPQGRRLTHAKYFLGFMKDYSEMSIAYRPSHADATYDMKYGIRAVQGGGRSSARETIGRVAAGAVAKTILKLFSRTEVLAYVSQVHNVVLPLGLVDHDTLTLEQIESNIVRCPNPEYAEKMIAAIDTIRVRGDSIGGVVTCIVRNCPRGLGSPVFDKLEAELSKAVMSLPATKGFEFGSGFAGTFLTGSEHNDEFYVGEHGRIRTRTNRSGGIQGGVSNGEIINLRVAFKPTATIGLKMAVCLIILLLKSSCCKYQFRVLSIRALFVPSNWLLFFYISAEEAAYSD
ncbi:Chorismate synthase 1 [Morus notabilis]|uniref:chorismate synthase n=1 Tax=Morus notabilis TaxID=981085 RepID=W9RAG6_9ROSA|nr:Chorismate synthase 1 [Morus notabilis]